MTRADLEAMLKKEAFAKANRANPDLSRLNIAQEPKSEEPDVKERMRDLLARGIRPATAEEKLNQNEREYLAWLRTLGDYWIGVQCITLQLAPKLTYTPDFWALDNQGMRAIDTKGPHVWEDSIVKIKIAAKLFPWVRFIFARKNGLVWEHRDFKP